MSEIKLQESSPNELDGGQQVLERRGNEGLEQNTMSFCRGSEVPASSASSARRFTNGPKQGSEMNGVSPRPESVTTNGLTVDGRQAEPARPVDLHKHGAPAVLPPNPGPRDGMTQAKV